MADTYKRVRQIAEKYSQSDAEMEEMIAKYTKKKDIFAVKGNMRKHGQLKSLEINRSMFHQKRASR